MGSRAHPNDPRSILGSKNKRAHPPHVDGRAVLLAAETQLWRPVPSGHHSRGHVSPGAAVGSREPEIGQLHLAVACVQQVVGFEVLVVVVYSLVGQRKEKLLFKAMGGAATVRCVLYSGLVQASYVRRKYLDVL